MGSLKESIYALSAWIFRRNGPGSPASLTSSQVKFICSRASCVPVLIEQPEPPQQVDHVDPQPRKGRTGFNLSCRANHKGPAIQAFVSQSRNL
jgi:hypothetical protein